MAVKFQSDTIIMVSNLAASKLHEILRKTSVCLVNRGPEGPLPYDETVIVSIFV